MRLFHGPRARVGRRRADVSRAPSSTYRQKAVEWKRCSRISATPCPRRAAPPVYAVVAVLTLAPGMGLNTLIFSVSNGVLRPLPLRGPGLLVRLHPAKAAEGGVQSAGFPASQPARPMSGQIATRTAEKDDAPTDPPAENARRPRGGGVPCACRLRRAGAPGVLRGPPGSAQLLRGVRDAAPAGGESPPAATPRSRPSRPPPSPGFRWNS